MNQSKMLGAKLKSMVIVLCGTAEFLENARSLLFMCQAHAQRASWVDLLAHDHVLCGLRWDVGPDLVPVGLFFF
jgi:hypothetical protein